MATPRNNDDIDYTAEGNSPPHEKNDPTNEGYDEAAHRGPASDGAFGTSGGGSYERGFQEVEETARDTERTEDE